MGHPGLAIAAALALLGACAGDEPRVIRLERVAPPADPDCGAPADARTLLVRAIGDFPAGDSTVRSLPVEGGELALDGLPPDTVSLEVEVLGFGGALRAVGRTAPFDIAALDDGAAVPIFMAPLRGACRTGPPVADRNAPLLARAGAGALIAGGLDPDGAPVHELELYDPATGELRALGATTYGADLAAGLAGASMTALPDGRVVIAGGGATAFQVFDPAGGAAGAAGSGAIDGPRFLREARAHHAAVALGGDRLLLAGGCARLEGAACAGDTALATSAILAVDTGELTTGPPLARLRIGGAAHLEADGRVLLVGGTDPSGAPVLEAERIDPARARASEIIAGVGHASAPLASGGILAGFAPPGAPATAAASVVPPGAGEASPVDGGAPRSGAVAVALESGPVLIVGGAAPGGDAGLLVPARGALDPVPGPLGDLTGHAAVALDDGAVLVVGGRTGAGEPGGAWIFRPELVGPFTGGLAVTFATAASSAALVPRDPARARVIAASAERPAHVRITAEAAGPEGSAAEWAVLAGPRFGGLVLEANLAAEAGGAGALLWFRGPGDHALVALEPGRNARLLLVESGEVSSAGGCRAQPIAAGDLAPPERGAGHELTVTARDGELRATLDGREVLRCEIDLPGPSGRGLVGLAPLGTGAALRVDLLGATRP